MILEPFQKFGQLFDECSNEFLNKYKNDLHQKKWVSEIKDGEFKRLIYKSILDPISCRKKFDTHKKYYDLKTEFFEIPLISNSNINKDTLLDEFIETYFYFSQKPVFDKNIFSHTYKILNKYILNKHLNKFYFFTPLYNFDTDFESIEIDTFKILKNTHTFFDRITNIDQHNEEKEPFIDYPIKKLKYILMFYTTRESGKTIEPKKISSKFLSALRLTTSGPISFGNFYLFYPLDWQGPYLPSLKENVKSYDNNIYFLNREKIDILKKIFQLLKKISSDFDANSIHYLISSISRFDYIYRNATIDDDITNLIISLETMLNYQPFEVTDKTSLRAAVILGKDNEKMTCKTFIQKCYGIRSEILHGKNKKTKIIEDGIRLTDKEIKEKLEDYVRKSILTILTLHMKYNTQKNVLNQIDHYILDRTKKLFD